MYWFESDWETLKMDDWHDVLQLRINVFVVEQDCPYPELDGKDKGCFHLWAREEGTSEGSVGGCGVLACVRLVPPGVSYTEPSIGRVATASSQRGNGLGVELMAQSIAACERHWPGLGVRISAQCYLDGFYQRLGFEPVGASYLEDNIPHIQMFRPSKMLGELFDELDRAKADWVEVFSRSEPIRQPLQGWNAGEILQHLVFSSGTVLAYLEKKCQADPKDLPEMDLDSDGRGRKLLTFLSSGAKRKMPAVLRSPERDSTAEQQAAWLVDWERAHAGLREQLSVLEQHWWRVQVFNHPVAGRLSLVDTVRFLTAHIGHHQEQVARLVKSRP